MAFIEQGEVRTNETIVQCGCCPESGERRLFNMTQWGLLCRKCFMSYNRYLDNLRHPDYDED